MKMFSKFFLIIFNFSIIKVAYSERPILLILLYDGFRNDYLDRGITPTLNNFRDNGVYAPYIQTVYPALAEPNIHSISTGLYPRTHPYFSRKGQRTGTLESDVTEKIKKETPIWNLNTDNGGKSACMMWWASDLVMKGGKGTCEQIQKYDSSMSLRKRADQVITWLNVTDTKSRPNLVLFYVEELDRISHFFGPLSRNSSLMIRRLDLLTKYIINKLMELNVYHITNIMILSDHGVRPILDTKAFRTIYSDPAYYKTESGQYSEDDVNQITSIPNFNEYLQNKKPEYLKKLEDFANEGRYLKQYTVVSVPRGTEKTGVIEYAAAPGYAYDIKRWKVAKYISTYKSLYPDLENPHDDPDRPYGVHGYLRQNDAIFMAKGPQLARFKKIEPFIMVDLFSAFTKLLGIQGDYEMEGNFSRILPIFRVREPVNWPPIVVTMAILAIISTIAFQLLVQKFLDTEADTNIDW